jgi:acetyl-CoA carboxylase biotin carboxylase subunit
VGLPVVPGTDKVVKTKEDALKIANKLKYPVIVKAAAGGGGKGMRVCHNDVRLVSAILTAQREAEVSFGNPDIYIEKYIEKPRHIEIQLLGDQYGHVVYLGERDCTIQRRHQKLIEETPSPAINEKLRKRMGELAVKAAKSVNYYSAGTIEFLLDKNGEFYFMEMNTRIQVEHPVTEMVTGLDLVKEQINIANGKRLALKQEEIKLNGWAIEGRIYAEDPDKNFMPSPGKITEYEAPGGRGVRLDTHVHTGYTVSPYYDSMIGKLITYGKTRKEAIDIMRRALEEYTIKPIKTTIPLLRNIFNNPIFIKGDISTDFLNTLEEEQKP